MLKETPKLVTKLKHVNIYSYQLCQEIANQHIQLQWVPTTDMLADGLTKALPCQKHKAFICQLNLVDIESLIRQDKN